MEGNIYESGGMLMLPPPVPLSSVTVWQQTEDGGTEPISVPVKMVPKQDEISGKMYKSASLPLLSDKLTIRGPSDQNKQFFHQTQQIGRLPYLKVEQPWIPVPAREYFPLYTENAAKKVKINMDGRYQSYVGFQRTIEKEYKTINLQSARKIMSPTHRSTGALPELRAKFDKEADKENEKKNRMTFQMRVSQNCPWLKREKSPERTDQKKMAKAARNLIQNKDETPQERGPGRFERSSQAYQDAIDEQERLRREREEAESSSDSDDSSTGRKRKKKVQRVRPLGSSLLPPHCKVWYDKYTKAETYEDMEVLRCWRRRSPMKGKVNIQDLKKWDSDIINDYRDRIMINLKKCSQTRRKLCKIIERAYGPDSPCGGRYVDPEKREEMAKKQAEEEKKKEKEMQREMLKETFKQGEGGLNLKSVLQT